jgi:SpoVK/Ycf46/Vps4 family AAA+-type ATPase
LIIKNAETALSKSNRRSRFFNLFDFDSRFDDGKKSDEELNSDEYLLNKSLTPTIWLTDDPFHLTDETVGRFFMHCEVKGGTRQDRRDEVNRVTQELGLSKTLADQLAKYYQLSSHQVRTAAEVVKLLDKKEPEASELILASVERSQKALGREGQEDIRDSVTKYDLSLLNVKTRYTPQQIIDALKKSGRGTLCFYGLPGTGKTQLAEYIATCLDKPLITKTASEILSKWLGESEKNIAAAFAEAKSENAVLFIDEVDSMLRDRSFAEHSWEVTQVNELLKRMEQFNGIFIAATNLMSQVDAAALRRFTFKIQFNALTEEQRIRMFENESGAPITKDSQVWQDLILIPHLTPGDFAAVKRQENILSLKFSQEDWIEQLEIEAAAKAQSLTNLGLGGVGGQTNMKHPS